MANGYFYAFADEAAAETAGALVEGEINGAPALVPANPQAVVLRTAGIELTAAVFDPATRTVTTPAEMSLPLVILSPAILPGCSHAVIVPHGHRGFA